MAELFAFEDVCVEVAGKALLRDVTAVVVNGTTVVMGPSGAGKTTLLRLCNRLTVPTRGRVRHEGVDLDVVDPLELRRRVGMVFQHPVVLPGTVRDNLVAADHRVGDDECIAALREVSLDASILDQPAVSLSGGEAQRLCLARARLLRPQVLLLDEPTSSLDATSARVIERLVARLVADGGSGVVVTHDVEQARRMADQVIVLDGGGVVATGAAGILDDPDVVRAVSRR